MQLFLDAREVFANLLRATDHLYRSYAERSGTKIIAVIVSPWIRPARIAVDGEVLELDEYFAYLASRCHTVYVCSRDPVHEQGPELERRRMLASRIQSIVSMISNLASTSNSNLASVLDELLNILHQLKRDLNRSERRYREEVRLHKTIQSIPNVVLRYNKDLHAKLYAVLVVKDSLNEIMKGFVCIGSPNLIPTSIERNLEIVACIELEASSNFSSIIEPLKRLLVACSIPIE